MNLILSASKAAVEAARSGEPAKARWAAATVIGGGLTLLGASKTTPKVVRAIRKDGSQVEFVLTCSGSVQFERLPEAVREALCAGKRVLIKDAHVEAAQAILDSEIDNLA
jgi:hypothetical protein